MNKTQRREIWVNWNPQKDQQQFQPKRGWKSHHHVETTVDWCRLLNLSPLLSGYNGFSDTHLYRRMMWLLSWPDREHNLCPPQSLVVSLSSSLFSWTGGVLSDLNSLTNRFPQFPLRNLCSLVIFAVCSLVFAAKDTAFC